MFIPFLSRFRTSNSIQAPRSCRYECTECTDLQPAKKSMAEETSVVCRAFVWLTKIERFGGSFLAVIPTGRGRRSSSQGSVCLQVLSQLRLDVGRTNRVHHWAVYKFVCPIMTTRHDSLCHQRRGDTTLRPDRYYSQSVSDQFPCLISNCIVYGSDHSAFHTERENVTALKRESCNPAYLYIFRNHLKTGKQPAQLFWYNLGFTVTRNFTPLGHFFFSKCGNLSTWNFLHRTVEKWTASIIRARRFVFHSFLAYKRMFSEKCFSNVQQSRTSSCSFSTVCDNS